MRYNPFAHYDKYGCLRPPLGLYLSLAFLLRGYLVWIVALSFRQDSARLLSLFYPDKTSFVTALVVGVPALITAAVISLRRAGMPKWIELSWSHIPKFLLISALVQLILLLGFMPAFHRLTPMSVIALFLVDTLGLLVIMIYSVKNRHLKDASKEFPQAQS